MGPQCRRHALNPRQASGYRSNLCFTHPSVTRTDAAFRTFRVFGLVQAHRFYAIRSTLNSEKQKNWNIEPSSFMVRPCREGD